MKHEEYKKATLISMWFDCRFAGYLYDHVFYGIYIHRKTFPYVIFTTGSVLIWWWFLTTSMLAVWEKSLLFYSRLLLFGCFFSYVSTGAGSCLLLNRFELLPDCSDRLIRLIQKPSCIKFPLLLSTLRFDHVRIHLYLSWSAAMICFCLIPFYPCFTLFKHSESQ